MTKARRGWRRDDGERGVALVEFALILPALVLLVFGVLDFGKAINYWLDANHLANEGARYAVVNKNLGSASLEAYLDTQADTPELASGGTNSVPSPGLRVCVTYPDGGAKTTGNRVVVRATVQYNWLPVLGLDVATSTVDGSAAMRIEQNITESEYNLDNTC
jgi:Flp pilus assembly protein TadG